MNNAHPRQTAEVGAPGKVANIVAGLGSLTKRTNTVRAEVLCRTLSGERMTGMDAVFGASTTRLAATIEALEQDYGWRFERADRVVGCKDGRTATIRRYWLSASIIEAAMGQGAEAWCNEVRAARSMLRRKAGDAQRTAARKNAAAERRRIALVAAGQGEISFAASSEGMQQ